MTTFFTKPVAIRKTAFPKPLLLKKYGLLICGRKSIALTIGPATSWGKNETKKAKSRSRLHGFILSLEK